MRLRARTGALIVACVACTACSRSPNAPASVSQADARGSEDATKRPATFAFDPLDERPVSSEVTRGKPTVLAFVTTGDLLGQAQVDFLIAMAKNDRGRVNYALVALHPRKEIVLVDTYVRALHVEFPVALGSPAATMPDGPFGEIPAVPTVVVLDRQGRLVFKHTGLVKSDVLRAQMKNL